MKAQNHPEYPQEQERLYRAVGYKEAALARPFCAAGIDYRADYAIALADKRYRSNLRESRQQAYFARVDEPSGNAGRHTLYIGKHYIHSLSIYSWADTRAGDLYYRAPHRAPTEPPTEPPQILLKRTYEISHTTLEAIRDE